MDACQIQDAVPPLDQQTCIFSQTMLAPPFGFSAGPSCGLPSLYPLFPVGAPSQAAVAAWSMAAPTFQPMLSFSPDAVSDEKTAPVQSFRPAPIDVTAPEPVIKDTALPEGDADSSNRNVSKSRAIVAGPDKLAMKKRDNAASSSDSAPLPTKKRKQPAKRAPRRIWSDEEHSAYLRFVRYKAINGRIDERILTTIPNRTLVQIKQYNYKYNIYRDNGLDVVDDAFSHNHQVVVDFSNFINTIVSRYCVDKTGVLLGLYDSIAFQWNIYHSLRILGSTSSTSVPQCDHGSIPPFSSCTLRNICLGVMEIIQKPVFRNTSFQIFELVRFLTTLRRYIDNIVHIQAYNRFVKFLSLLTDGLDLTRCNNKITSADLQTLFSLCEDPSTADKALRIATSMEPSVYISFQCAPGADTGALRAVTNLESCHLHVPHIPSSVYQMLCSVASQICHELGPRTCLYLSTTFLVYLQILNGSVDEIIYEIYKYGALRCTDKAVSEQSTLILCMAAYILCFGIVQYEESEAP